MERITAEEIKTQLAEILNSADFQASQRLKDFLSYVVEQTLSGKGGGIKAYNLAVDVFGLGESFDPRVNPLIRTEAGRLRGKLDHYYLLNPAAKIHITMPKGGYAAVFARRQEAEGQGASQLSDGAGRAASFVWQKVAQPGYKAAIQVSPFENINATEDVRHFIAGLSNEVVVGLTKFRELRIVDHSHPQRLGPFAQRGKAKPTGSEPRFVLSGSVQMESDTFKIWSFLTDATTGYNIWAEKFNVPASSAPLLKLQEEVAKSIVNRVADDFGLLYRTLLKEVESGASDSSSLQEAALLYYHWTTVLTKPDFEKALNSLEKALINEPEHVPSMAMLADIYASDYQWSYNLVDNALEKSLQLAARAVNLDPECQLGHLAMALNHHLRADREAFINSAEQAIKVNPYSTNILSALATWYGIGGMWDKGLALIDKVMAISPTCPIWCHITLAMHDYARGDYVGCFTKVKMIDMPGAMWLPLMRLAAGAFLGKRDECDRALAELVEIHTDFKENCQAILSQNMPNGDMLTKVRLGLERAGLTFAA